MRCANWCAKNGSGRAWNEHFAHLSARLLREDRRKLIELCKVAAKYQGKCISHMRSEGSRLLEALDELIRISREANIPAEVYHIKALAAKTGERRTNYLLISSRRKRKD